MIRALLCLLFVVFIAPASAQEIDNQSSSIQVPIEVKVTSPDFSVMKHTKSGKIRKVIDGLTILLKDGTIVRLSSIYIPDFHIWEGADFSETALKFLQEKLPENTEVMLYQTRNTKWGRTNRMGHEMAHLVVKKDNFWLQGALLAQGLAHVKTIPNSNDMLEQMLSIEGKARNLKIGIWSADSEFKAIDVADAQNKLGSFSIVEGKVKKIATIRNNIYLNFGQDWKTDFTVMVTSKMRRDFAKKFINLQSLSGKTIRVRGNIREYNGPLIELDTTAHLEILDNAPNEALQNTEETPNLAP